MRARSLLTLSNQRESCTIEQNGTGIAGRCLAGWLIQCACAAQFGPIMERRQPTVNGLMWANTVGLNLSWSSTGAAGSVQGWVAGLNASDYGGYNDWTLATGNGSVGANTMTNQLGELFYTDCGNSVGTSTVFNKPGKKCTALSA